jgi:hypothetical protein
MTRSPLFYPLNRGMDADAGGIADLQTDVMRFIAILALCLVAIFALVQSLPLMPTVIKPPAVQAPQADLSQTAAPEPVTAEPEIIEQEPSPQSEEEKPLIITRPAPQRIPFERAPREIIEATIPTQVVETSVPEEELLEPAVSEPMPPATSQGFTLRFETDLALTRLVARNEVGLYAITPEKSLRMNVNRGALSFWAASVPNQFHEMDEATVPDDVLSALRRAGSVKTSDVKWGVTLPPNMRQQLDRFLSEHDGGALVIGGDGGLRLEP